MCLVAGRMAGMAGTVVTLCSSATRRAEIWGRFEGASTFGLSGGGMGKGRIGMVLGGRSC
jgi:hypothetical protein